MDPSVSVPMDKAAKFAATATADPDDEPQGVESKIYGFFVKLPRADQPETEFELRKLAHSDMFAFPRIIAPALRSLLTIPASLGTMLLNKAQEPAVVFKVSFVAILSY